ncbi:hypothetical protein VPH35_111201 [Triticum aestivum]
MGQRRRLGAAAAIQTYPKCPMSPKVVHIGNLVGNHHYVKMVLICYVSITSLIENLNEQNKTTRRRTQREDSEAGRWCHCHSGGRTNIN